MGVRSAVFDLMGVFICQATPADNLCNMGGVMKLMKKTPILLEYATVLLAMVLTLWFCIAALWKTYEVVRDAWGAVGVDVRYNYYEVMDRMDAAVERFWKGE